MPVEEPTPVEEIVSGCRRGESDAQRRLFELFHRRVYRLSFRMVGERDAPDVTQDAFLRVFQKIGQFRGDSRFETWLYRLTVNECLQHLRRSGSRRENPLLSEPDDGARPQFEKAERRELLEHALTRLEPDLRSIFLLREVDNLNYREIAEATQLAEGTVASRLNRARRQLRKILVELGWEP